MKYYFTLLAAGYAVAWFRWPSLVGLFCAASTMLGLLYVVWLAWAWDER